ncbi:MAG TPA: heme ABC exporter ATP-binding protein CcmA [Sedimentisphaerales bacterium]|nr:heme ABC exporter ATP-binding protein CcmA [Sedimentisphaerales bacterium]
MQQCTQAAPSVNLAGVCKSFANTTVLKSISLSVSAGESLCICGPNAAGKTTLLRIIAGLLKPTHGQVTICGFDLRRRSDRAKPLVGAVLHKSMLYPQLTVSENLRFFAQLYGLPDSKSRIEQLLTQLHLGAHTHDRTETLSRGIIQRLAIARAMLHKPAILLADEPFTGLDAQATGDFLAILAEFANHGGAVLMTTHNPQQALKCCGRVAVLHDHRFIFTADVPEINTSEFAADYLSYTRNNC